MEDADLLEMDTEQAFEDAIANALMRGSSLPYEPPDPTGFFARMTPGKIPELPDPKNTLTAEPSAYTLQNSPAHWQVSPQTKMGTSLKPPPMPPKSLVRQGPKVDDYEEIGMSLTIQPPPSMVRLVDGKWNFSNVQAVQITTSPARVAEVGIKRQPTRKEKPNANKSFCVRKGKEP